MYDGIGIYPRAHAEGDIRLSRHLTHDEVRENRKGTSHRVLRYTYKLINSPIYVTCPTGDKDQIKIAYVINV